LENLYEQNKPNRIIIGIQGPVINVRFEEESPLVYEALLIELANDKTLTLEVASLLETTKLKL